MSGSASELSRKRSTRLVTFDSPQNNNDTNTNNDNVESNPFKFTAAKSNDDDNDDNYSNNQQHIVIPHTQSFGSDRDENDEDTEMNNNNDNNKSRNSEPDPRAPINLQPSSLMSTNPLSDLASPLPVATLPAVSPSFSSSPKNRKRKESFWDFFNDYDDEQDHVDGTSVISNSSSSRQQNNNNNKDNNTKIKSSPSKRRMTITGVNTTKTGFTDDVNHEGGSDNDGDDGIQEDLDRSRSSQQVSSSTSTNNRHHRVFDMITDFRSHFINTKNEAARLHLTLQATQVIPPTDDNFFSIPDSGSSPGAKKKNNKKSSKNKHDVVDQARNDDDDQIASSFFTPQRQILSSLSASPGNMNGNNLINNNNQEVFFYSGASPIQREVFTVSKRKNYDMWLQEETEFTQLCLFKVEDVFRCKLMKMRRETMENATMFTFERLLDDIQMQEILLRVEMWQEEEALTMELFCRVELAKLVARRQDFILRLSALKVYLRVWPGIVEEKRQFLLAPEDDEWERLLKLNSREVKKIAKAPLSRFWLRKDEEARKEDQQIARELLGQHQDEEECQNRHQDDNSSFNLIKNETLTPEPEPEDNDIYNSSKSLLSTTYINHDAEQEDNVACSDTNSRTSRSLKSKNNNHKHESEKTNNDGALSSASAVPSSNIPLHHYNQNFQQKIAVIKSQRLALNALERRARSLLQEEEKRQFTKVILLPGLTVEENFFREPLQDRIWSDGVRIRQKFLLESQRVVILDKEEKLRAKWMAMENTQWRFIIEETEALDWQEVLNRHTVVYQTTGLLYGRMAKQHLQIRAGHVISLFARQRREVLRVVNVRKNFGRFFQRCGRGYLSRRRSCADRLYMLKCQREAFDRLKFRLSFLLSQFIRCKFSRSQVVMYKNAKLIQLLSRAKNSGTLVWKKHNQRDLYPQLQVILGHLYFWYSSRRIVHDERRVHHCSRIIQQSMRSFSQQQYTRRVILIRSRTLPFLTSFRHVEKIRNKRIDLVLTLFVKNALENYKKALVWNSERFQAALTLQKVGRGALNRTLSLRPDHLYCVQEQLFAAHKIAKWLKSINLKLKERYSSSSSSNNSGTQETFINNQRYETKNNNHNNNTIIIVNRQVHLSFNHLLTSKRNRLLDEEYFLDQDVIRFAITKLQSWWRMIALKRRYSVWKISDFFVRHRLRTQHNFMQNKFVTKADANEVEHFADSSEKCSFVVGDEQNNKEESYISTSPDQQRRLLLLGSSCFVVGEKEEEDDDEQHELHEDKIIAARDSSPLPEMGLTEDESLEEEMLESYAIIVEDFVATRKQLRVIFKYEHHEALHKEYTRRFSSLLRQETSLRFRIQQGNLCWWRSFSRMMKHYDFERSRKAVLYFYFVPFDKKDYSVDKEIELEKKQEEEHKILHGFKISADELAVIKRQRRMFAGDVFFDGGDEDENKDDKDAKKELVNSNNDIDHDSPLGGKQTRSIIHNETRHGLDLLKAQDYSEHLTSGDLVSLIRKRRQEREEEGRRLSQRPMSALSLLPTSRIYQQLEEEHDHFNKQVQMDGDKPPSSSHSASDENIFIKSSTKWLRQKSHLASSLASNRRPQTAAISSKTRSSDADLHEYDDERNKDGLFSSNSNNDNARTTTATISSSTIRMIQEQRATSKLHPPTGKHFDLFTGVFDVCRWWGNKMKEHDEGEMKKRKLKNKSNSSTNSDKQSQAGASRSSSSSAQYAGASLDDVCAEVQRCKPIEVLGMASIWFVFNGATLAAVLNSCLLHNRKNLKRVHVLSKLDAEFVERMLRRERLSSDVKVYSLECDKDKIDDYVL